LLFLATIAIMNEETTLVG